MLIKDLAPGMTVRHRPTGKVFTVGSVTPTIVSYHGPLVAVTDDDDNLIFRGVSVNADVLDPV